MSGGDPLLDLKSCLLDVLDEVGREVDERSPRGQLELSYGQGMSAALFYSCCGLYLGARLLLRRDLAVEAEILGRTLMHDSVHLVYFAGQRRSLEQVVVRYELGLIEKELGLRRHELHAAREDFAAGRAGADTVALDAPAQRVTDLEEERREFARVANERSWPINPLPGPENLLVEMSQSRATLVMHRASGAVHTSRLSLDRRLSGTEIPEFSIRASSYDVIQTGGPLSEMFLAAAESTLRILQLRTQADALSAYHDGVSSRVATIMHEANAIHDGDLPPERAH